MGQHSAGIVVALVGLFACACGGDDSSPGGGSGGASGGAAGSGASSGSGGSSGSGASSGSGGSSGSGASSGSGGAAGGGTGGTGAVSGCVPKSSGWITDAADHPEPSLPSLPSAGSRVADPTFGTEVIRITDGGDGSECVNAYSYWPTFNANSTRLFLNCSSGSKLYDFDPTTATASNKRSLFAKSTPDGTNLNWEDAVWSNLEPDVLYSHDTVKLWKYDVSSGAYTLVKDFGSLTGSGHVRQMSMSADDTVFGFTQQDANWNATGALAWRASDDKVLLQQSQPGLDEVQVDKSGKWLVIKTGKQGAGAIEVRVADLQTQGLVDLTDDGPDFSPGHSDNGNGIVVGADNWTNRLTFRTLVAPKQLTSVLELKDDWTQDFHVSMRAKDESQVLVSFYQSTAHTTGLFHNEIIQVTTDGSQKWRRLAHHRSDYADYWDSPRANISQDGCFVAFTSTWGSSGRRDVFVLNLSK
ncbi:MAG: hypothetical protein R3B13_15600 [Polyangiaceae bacterium]